MGVIRTAAARARQEERTERRRTQILDAARACVRAEGFHATTVSRIATEASVSVGHIYQYFESKEAVMIALSERDFEAFMQHLTQMDHHENKSIDAAINMLISKIMWLMGHDRAALQLDIMTEASRNETISDLVKRSDQRLAQSVRHIVEPVLEAQTESQIRICVETVLLMMRAIIVHAGTHKVSDPDVLKSGLERSLRGLLTFS